MKKKVKTLIKDLKLQPHPEGGYYCENYRSDISFNGINQLSKDENRNLATSIYFLLNESQVSTFHQLASDEIWYFHTGSAVKIYMIELSGNLDIKILGTDTVAGHNPQVCIPAGTIFGAELIDKDSFALIGCMVTPGFDFRDFKLIPREELIERFAQHCKIINKLTQ